MNQLLLSLLSSQGPVSSASATQKPQNVQSFPTQEKPIIPIFSGLLAEIQAKRVVPHVFTNSNSANLNSLEQPSPEERSESEHLQRVFTSVAMRQDLPQLQDIPLSRDLPPLEEITPTYKPIHQQTSIGTEGFSLSAAESVPLQKSLGVPLTTVPLSNESQVTTGNSISPPIFEHPSAGSREIHNVVNVISRGQVSGNVPINPIAVSTKFHQSSSPVLKSELASQELGVLNERVSSRQDGPSIQATPILGSLNRNSQEVPPQVPALDTSPTKPSPLPGKQPLAPQQFVPQVQDLIPQIQRPAPFPVVPPTVPQSPLTYNSPSSLALNGLQGNSAMVNGTISQAIENASPVSTLESTTTTTGEQGKGNLDSMFRGSSGEFGNGQDLANGFGNAPQGQTTPQHQASSPLSHNLSVRSGEEKFPDMPSTPLQRLKMDVQLSENSRVQVEVGVQQRQVYAGMIMDQSALKNLAVQFVPQLESQLTQVDLELQEFSAEVRDQQESGKKEDLQNPEGLVFPGKSSPTAGKASTNTTVVPEPDMNEPGLHLVA